MLSYNPNQQSPQLSAAVRRSCCCRFRVKSRKTTSCSDWHETGIPLLVPRFPTSGVPGKSLCPEPEKSRRSPPGATSGRPARRRTVPPWKIFPFRWIKSRNSPQSGARNPQNFSTMSTDHLYEASSKNKLHSPLVPPVEEVLSQRSGPHSLLLRHLMYQCIFYNNPWKIFLPEKYSPLKDIHPWKIFTPEKYWPMKDIPPWKIFTPEKYSSLKNINPWKIFTTKKYSPLGG